MKGFVFINFTKIVNKNQLYCRVFLFSMISDSVLISLIRISVVKCV